LDKNITIYDGKVLKKIKITREKLGFKVGEFVFTLEQLIKKKIIKKSKKKNKKKIKILNLSFGL
jgi:ribosomal protein S19